MANSVSDSRITFEGPGLIESIRQYWIMAMALVVVFTLAGVGYASSSGTSYVAEAKIGLTDLAGNGSTSQSLGRYSSLTAQAISSDAVLAIAAKSLHEQSIQDLRDVVTATSDINSPVVLIDASASTQVLARDRANAVLAALRTFISTKSTDRRNKLQSALDVLRKRAQGVIAATGTARNPVALQNAQSLLNSLDTQEIAIANESVRFGDGVEFATAAVLPAVAGLKSIAIPGVIGGLVGAILATIGCWIIADRRRQIDDASIPGFVAGARLLGEVPTLRGGAAKSLSKFVEMPSPAFEFAAAGLWSGIESGVIMVSGADHGAGSTTTAANLAAAFARDGRRVVVIDTNANDRNLTRMAGIAEGTPGLSDVLTHRAPLEDSLRAVDLGDATSVAVLACGRAEPDLASLLRTRAMSETLDRLREWYDLIIIDTPPLATSAEGASLARNVDGVLFVVARGTQMRRIERLRDRLALLNLPVLGYVFNRDQAMDLTAGRITSSAKR